MDFGDFLSGFAMELVWVGLLVASIKLFKYWRYLGDLEKEALARNAMVRMRRVGMPREKAVDIGPSYSGYANMADNCQTDHTTLVTYEYHYNGKSFRYTYNKKYAPCEPELDEVICTTSGMIVPMIYDKRQHYYTLLSACFVVTVLMGVFAIPGFIYLIVELVLAVV